MVITECASHLCVCAHEWNAKKAQQERAHGRKRFSGRVRGCEKIVTSHFRGLSQETLERAHRVLSNKAIDLAHVAAIDRVDRAIFCHDDNAIAFAAASNDITQR